MKINNRGKNRGLSLVEVMLGTAILLFVLAAGFLGLQSISTASVAHGMRSRASQFLQNCEEELRFHAIEQFGSLDDYQTRPLDAENLEPKFSLVKTISTIDPASRTRNVLLTLTWKEGLHKKEKRLSFNIAALRGRAAGGSFMVRVYDATNNNGTAATPYDGNNPYTTGVGLPGVEVYSIGQESEVTDPCRTDTEGICFLSGVKLGAGTSFYYDGYPAGSIPVGYFQNSPGPAGGSWKVNITSGQYVSAGATIMADPVPYYPLGEVTGRVQEFKGGVLTSTVTVILRSKPDLLVINDPASKTTETSLSGEFVFSHVIPGRYIIRVVGSSDYVGVTTPNDVDRWATCGSNNDGHCGFDIGPHETVNFNMITERRSTVTFLVKGLLEPSSAPGIARTHLKIEDSTLPVIVRFDTLNYGDSGKTGRSRSYFAGVEYRFNSSPLWGEFYDNPLSTDFYSLAVDTLALVGIPPTSPGITSISVYPVAPLIVSYRTPLRDHTSRILIGPSNEMIWPHTPIFVDAPFQGKAVKLAQAKYLIRFSNNLENGDYNYVAPLSSDIENFTFEPKLNTNTTTGYFILSAKSFGNIRGEIKKLDSNPFLPEEGFSFSAVLVELKRGKTHGMLRVKPGGKTKMIDHYFLDTLPDYVNTRHSFSFSKSGPTDLGYNTLPPNIGTADTPGGNETCIQYKGRLAPTVKPIDLVLEFDAFTKLTPKNSEELEALETSIMPNPNPADLLEIQAFDYAGRSSTHSVNINYGGRSVSKNITYYTSYLASGCVKVLPAGQLPLDLYVDETKPLTEYLKYRVEVIGNDNWISKPNVDGTPGPLFGPKSLNANGQCNEPCTFTGPKLVVYRKIWTHIHGHLSDVANSSFSIVGAKVTLVRSGYASNEVRYSDGNGNYDFETLPVVATGDDSSNLKLQVESPRYKTAEANSYVYEDPDHPSTKILVPPARYFKWPDPVTLKQGPKDFQLEFNPTSTGFKL